MSKPHRPVLRPLIIPPATTSANIRNVTAVHNPIQTSVKASKPTSPRTPSTLSGITLTPSPPPEKDTNGSTHHKIPKTPQIIDSVPLTPLPTYFVAHTNRSTKVNRRCPNTGTPHTSGRPCEDLEHQAAARNILGVDGKKNGGRWDSKAGIVAACVGAVLGVVGLTVYFIVIKAKGEIDT